MLISQRDSDHGLALIKLINYQKYTAINKHSNLNSKYAYLLNEYKGLYIKHTRVTKKNDIFTSNDEILEFNFTSKDLSNIKRLHKMHEKQTYLLLVCNREQICAINYTEFVSCVDIESKTNQKLTVCKPPQKCFRIIGDKGKYDKPIPVNSFPDKLFC